MYWVLVHIYTPRSPRVVRGDLAASVAYQCLASSLAGSMSTCRIERQGKGHGIGPALCFDGRDMLRGQALARSLLLYKVARRLLQMHCMTHRGGTTIYWANTQT